MRARSLPGLAAACLLLLRAAPPLRAQTLEIRSDPRVDLVGIVDQLSGNSRIKFYGLPIPFRVESLKRFETFRDHPLVRRVAKLRAAGFDGLTLTQYVLYYGDPPEFKPRWAPPGHFARLAGGQAELDALNADLRDFAVRSKFMDWYVSESSASAQLAGKLRATVAGADIEGALVRYLGMKSWARWIIVPSYFYSAGGASSWVVEEKPGLPHVYVVVGPLSERGKPGFGTASWLAGQIWSEAVYSTTYFMYELCQPALKLRADLCASVEGFEGSGNCLQIIWVQAITTRLMGAAFGSAAMKDYHSHRISKSENNTELVAALLEKYEHRRDKYRFLSDYTAELAAPFGADGKAPECRFYDPARFRSDEYTLQLGVYLDSRLAVEKDETLEKERAELRAASAPRSGPDDDR